MMPDTDATVKIYTHTSCGALQQHMTRVNITVVC